MTLFCENMMEIAAELALTDPDYADMAPKFIEHFLWIVEMYPELGVRMRRFLESRPEVRAAIHDPAKLGVAGRRLASILDERKLRRVLSVMLDENEFLSEFGLRSLSRFHEKHPYVFRRFRISRRSPTPGCSAATPTGAAPSGFR
jgi:hypothetical protein